MKPVNANSESATSIFLLKRIRKDKRIIVVRIVQIKKLSIGREKDVFRKAESMLENPLLLLEENSSTFDSQPQCVEES